jgi:secreted trypsin-like serine protease
MGLLLSSLWLLISLKRLDAIDSQLIDSSNKNIRLTIRSNDFTNQTQKLISSSNVHDATIISATTTTTKAAKMPSTLYNSKRKLRYYQSPDVQERIVGGKPVIAGAYPSYAIPVGSGLCGATLIHDDILITAAHCYGIFEDGIILGTVTLNGNSQTDVRKVSEEYPNPDFNEYTLANDVMLVKLAEPVTDTSIISPYNTDSSSPTVDQSVTVIGFGAQEEGGRPSKDLLEVQVQVVNYNDCYEDYWQPFFGSNIQNSVMICANGIDNETGGTLDSCQGMLLFPPIVTVFYF